MRQQNAICWNSLGPFCFFYPLSNCVEILWGFTKFFFKQLLKVSAFYLEKQKSRIPKKYDLGRRLKIGQESSNRWRLLSQCSVKVLVFSSLEWTWLEKNQQKIPSTMLGLLSSFNVYSRVPNKRSPLNKRSLWKICQIRINLTS